MNPTIQKLNELICEEYNVEIKPDLIRDLVKG